MRIPTEGIVVYGPHPSPSTFSIRIKLKSPLKDDHYKYLCMCIFVYIHTYVFCILWYFSYINIAQTIVAAGTWSGLLLYKFPKPQGQNPGAQLIPVSFLLWLLPLCLSELPSCLCLQLTASASAAAFDPLLSLLISPLLFSLYADCFSHASLLSKEKNWPRVDPASQLRSSITFPGWIVQIVGGGGVECKPRVLVLYFSPVCPCLHIQERPSTPGTCACICFLFLDLEIFQKPGLQIDGILLFI